MLGMVYWDCPFGIIPFCEWDKVLSEEEFEEVFKQISAVIKSQTCVCIFKVHHSQMGMIEKLMLKHKFVDAHPLYWWKTDQNVVGLKRYTFAVETLMVGYLGGRAQNQFNEAGLRANPENRHNLNDSPPSLSGSISSMLMMNCLRILRSHHLSLSTNWAKYTCLQWIRCSSSVQVRVLTSSAG